MKRVIEEPGTKRVGIWIRVSTEDQAKGQSPENHAARARMYAEAKGWKVVETYDLSGISGKTVMQQAETQRMLRDLHAGRIQALIFSKLARLARNTRELLDFADIFKAAGADLISLQESIDTSTPAGRLFYTVIAAMASWEREEISDRLVSRASTRAKLGKFIAGAAPFGYRWDKSNGDRRLVPDPNEAPVVRRMFELFAEHGRKKTVARLLNEAGYRTRKAARFGNTTIQWLLSSSTYKGKHRLNYSKGSDEGWALKPESEWGWAKVDPLVSDELWDRCNALLHASATNHRRPTKRAATLFGGRVICRCGQKMYVPSNTPKYVCKKCRNKIPATDLETIFQSQLRDFFFSPQQIAEHLESADSVLREKSELLAAMTREEEKLRTEAEKLYRLYVDDVITAETFGEKHHTMEERLAQLREEIPRLSGECDFLRIQALSADEVVSEARNLYSQWPQLDFDARRRIVENITERITIGDGDISIELCYLPLSSETKNSSSSEDLSKGVSTHSR